MWQFQMLYLGKTKTNHNCIHDYIKKKNKSGKFLAFSSESSVFSSPILYGKQVEGIFFFFGATTQLEPRSYRCCGSQITRNYTHTHTQHSSERVISPSQRPLPMQHTKNNTKDQHPCPQRDSNPQSQQTRGCRSTSYTARPLGSVVEHILPSISPRQEM